MEQRGQSSERLLLAISRVQSLFIDDANPETVFGLMLQELLQLTESEYGFIGEVLWDAEQKPYLQTHAITDTAWNAETRKLATQRASNLRFTNLTNLFGQVITTGQPVLSNDPPHDPRAGGIPSSHPPLHAFLGMPIRRGERVIGMAGIANRCGGYDESWYPYLGPFLSTCSQLLEGFHNRQRRIEAEAALRQSEDRFRAAVLGANEGIWDWNLKTNEAYFSPRWKAILGYADHELSHAYEEWESRLHPDDRDRVLAQLRDYLEGVAERYNVEFRMRKKNGYYCWINACGSVIRDADERPSRMAGSHQDITERKRMEALQDAEKQALELIAKGTHLTDVLTFICRAVETHAPSVLTSIMLADKDGTCLGSTAAPSLPDEYSRAVDGSPIGPTVGSCGSAAYFAKPAIVADISLNPLWKDYASLALAHGLQACWSHPILGSNGTLLGTFAVYHREPREPLPTDLKIIERASHIAALAIEHARITEALQESEARFQAFMRHNPAVTFIKDKAGRHIYVNPQFESLFGVTRHEVKGKTVFDFMPVDVAARLDQNDQVVFSSGETLEIEETLHAQDGAAKNWLVIKFPLEVERKQLLGGVAIDITERKRAEESLLRTQFAMDQAVDAVYWIDSAARILYTNEAASAMLGYTAEEFLRMTVHDLNPNFPPEVWPGFWAETREKKMISLETVHLTKYRRRIPIDIRVAFLAYGGQEFHCAFVRDISERKRIDEALRESQERFELAVCGTNDGIWDWDIVTGELYWSDRTYELLHLMPDDLTPSYEVWLALIHPADADYAHQAVRQHLDARAPYDIEIRVRMKDEGYRWFHAQGQAVWDSSGRPVRMVGSISDVTARRQAEEALWKAHAELEQRVKERTLALATTNRSLEKEILERKLIEDRLQRTQYAVDHAADQMFVMDSNGYFLDVNEAACRRLGYTKEELLTMSVKDIDPDFPPEAWNECWAQVTREGQLRIETRHRSKSGEIYPVEVVANYMCHNGQDLDCAIVRDITERKRTDELIRESELRYKLLTEATFDGVALHDDGVLLEVNPGLERMFGYGPGELIGRSIFDLVAAECRGQIALNMRDDVNGPYEILGRHKDGSTFPGEVVVRPYCYRGKQVRLVAGRDITTRRQLEAEKVRHMEELEREVAERTAEIAKLESQRAQIEKLAAVGQMAAAVAHEINNPIAGIRNAFTLVKQAVDQAHPHYEFVGMIDREISRVASIVQNMYQLYRKEPSKAEPVDLQLLLRDLEGLFNKRMSQRGLKFIVTQMPLRRRLRVPQSDLLQVLMNLIQNAIDSSPPTGTIKLNVYQEDDIVTISVSDEGSGIAPDVLPHIFDPFFTTKTQKDQKGMGLGLSVSQSLVMAMGGRIEVQTQPNAGSTFAVVLPQHTIVDPSPAQRNIVKEVLAHDS